MGRMRRDDALAVALDALREKADREGAPEEVQQARAALAELRDNVQSGAVLTAEESVWAWQGLEGLRSHDALWPGEARLHERLRVLLGASAAPRRPVREVSAMTHLELASRAVRDYTAFDAPGPDMASAHAAVALAQAADELRGVLDALPDRVSDAIANGLHHGLRVMR